LIAGGRNKKTTRTAPKSDNVYVKLLVKVRTGQPSAGERRNEGGEQQQHQERGARAAPLSISLRLLCFVSGAVDGARERGRIKTSSVESCV
jgi:large subunit ribosomal protein L18e